MTQQERPHHPYSPSWLQSGEVCPCFKSRDSKHARTIAGTIGHKVTETGEDDMRLSDDDALAAAECLDFYDSRRQLMEAEAITVGGEILELKETYLPIDDCSFADAESTTGGYIDRGVLNYDRTYGEFIDYKFGLWAVENADNNLQGLAYILGAFKAYPTLQKVRFYFKQPHLNLITHVDINRNNVADIYLRIQVVVARAREARQRGDFSLARPHTPICNFCAELGRCPKVAEMVCKVGHKFHPLAVPDDITPSALQDPKNTVLAMQLASVVKIWCDAFRRQVTDRVLRNDAPVPDGYQVASLRKRELVNLQKYKEVALKYLSPEEWESCLDTTFGAVEGKIKDNAPRGEKLAVVKMFQEEAAATGATKLGDEFSFLKVVSEKTTNKTQQKENDGN